MWAINSILEIIFPERVDHKIISQITISEFEKFYQLLQNDNWTALSSINEPVIKAAIHEAKFHNNEYANELLASLLKLYFIQLSHPALLLPIPLSKKRKQKRGYNQVLQISKAALKNQNRITLDEDILIKIKENPPQTSLGRAERIENAKDAYMVKPEEAKRISGQHVLVIDDVVTTGASLNAARKALLPHKPASITCVALAH